jgi:hypothetical protein
MVKETHGGLPLHLVRLSIHHNDDLNPGGNSMSNKHLYFFGTFALSIAAVSGCAQHMTKRDSVMRQPPAQMSQRQDTAQDKAVVPARSAAQDKSPPSTVATTDSAPTAASNATARQSAPKPDNKHSSAEEAAAMAKVLPLPPTDVVDAINTLTNLHRTRYLSRTAQYDFFVGGKIDAKYDINKSQLILTNSPAKTKDTVMCDYSKNGDMVTDKKAIPEQKVEECNKLINELMAYMER